MGSEKRRYYVSVQSKSIMLNQGDATYELEIDATPEQILELRELFEDEEDFENDTFWRAHIPAIPYHHDNSNDGYDVMLEEIYRKLYEWGTPETRAHIESMNVLH